MLSLCYTREFSRSICDLIRKTNFIVTFRNTNVNALWVQCSHAKLTAVMLKIESMGEGGGETYVG